MGHTHWTGDELLDRLYGLRDQAVPTECPACRARWEELLRRRNVVTTPPDLPPDVLAAQRQAIRSRIEGPPFGGRWAFAPAVAALVVGAFILQGPAPKPLPTLAEGPVAGDRALFEQVFREAAQTQPQSLAPVVAMFEVDR